jgi:hypothetical protein
VTDRTRKDAAQEFYNLLRKGVHRKMAFWRVAQKYQTCEKSVRRWCKKFGVPTNIY